MPERNIEFGKYGARGIKGHEAVARRLDALAGYIATPVTARRGLLARLHYRTRSDHACAAARAAGLTVTDRTVPRAMATIRNLAIGTLKILGADNIAKTTRAIRHEPQRSLAILGITSNPDTHET